MLFELKKKKKKKKNFTWENKYHQRSTVDYLLTAASIAAAAVIAFA